MSSDAACMCIVYPVYCVCVCACVFDLKNVKLLPAHMHTEFEDAADAKTMNVVCVALWRHWLLIN